MDDEWKDRLLDILETRDLSMKEASLSAGLGETYARDILKRGRSPSAEALSALARTLGTSVGYLVDGAEAPSPTIPVIGYAAAGEAWTPLDDINDTVEIDLSTEAVGLIIKGDSMSPVYRDGDIIAGNRKYGQQLSRWVGTDCIVLTSNGERYVKYLMKSPIRGRFTLRSYSPTHKDLESQKLEWAAPITLIKRRVGK